MMNNEDKIPIKVMGLSYSKVQSGAYALILAEIDGPHRIPVVIGPAEAQSIALHIERITPPRPMTHDLFASFTHAFGIQMVEVMIYQFEDGIFSSEITFSDGERTIKLDSRTSDAIAIAIRTGAPIYTTKKIIDETGFIIEDDDFGNQEDNDGPDNELKSEGTGTSTHQSRFKLENYSVEQLEKNLQQLIDDENYEEAARISEILKKKRNK